MKRIARWLGRTRTERKQNAEALAWEIPRGRGASAKDGRDGEAREQLAAQIMDRRTAMGLGLGGLAAAGVLGFSAGRASADLGDAIGGTHLDPNDIVSKRIAGVRIATEFDTAKHAGTDGDPWTDAAYGAAQTDTPNGGLLFFPQGVFMLTSRVVSKPIRLMGANAYLGDSDSGTVLRGSTTDFVLSVRFEFVKLMDLRIEQDGTGDCITYRSRDGTNPISNTYGYRLTTVGGRYGLFLDTNGNIINIVKAAWRDCEFRSHATASAFAYGNALAFRDCKFRQSPIGFDFQNATPTRPVAGGVTLAECVFEGNTSRDIRLVTGNSIVIERPWLESTCPIGIEFGWDQNAFGVRNALFSPIHSGTYATAFWRITGNLNCYGWVKSDEIPDVTDLYYTRVRVMDEIPPSAISPGASAYVYQNTSPYDVEVVVSGGTVSQIEYSHDGITYYNVGVTAGKFFLKPYDYLKTTYSSIPTMTKVPIG